MPDPVIDAVVQHVLDDGGGTVVIGPLVWQLNEHGGRRWYFTVAAGAEFHIDQFVVSQTDGIREAVITAFAQVNRALVVHVVEDEAEMVRLCAAIWPCPKTAKLLADIEAETRLH